MSTTQKARTIAETRWVYRLNKRDEQPANLGDPPIYRLCVAVAGEELAPVTSEPLYLSEECCDELNRKRGYTPEEAMRI